MDFLEQIKQYKNQIYREIYTALILGAFFCTFRTYLGVWEAGRGEIMCCLLSLLYLFLFTVFRIKGRLFLLAVPVVFGVAELLENGGEECVRMLTSYFQWALYGTGAEEYLAFYRALQIFWLTAFSSVLAFGRALSKRVRYLMFGGCVCAVVVFLVCRMRLSACGTAYWLALIMLHTVECIEERWQKKRVNKDGRAYMVWLWPVWLMVLLLLLAAPSSPEPYRWTFVKNAITKINDGWILLSESALWGDREGFAMHMGGFSEDGGIGGDLKKTDREMLHITASKKMLTNLYLGGITMDAFDGREWRSTGADSVRENRWDTMETFYGVQAQGDDNIGDYLVSVRLNMEYAHFSSFLYFVPLKMTELAAEQKNLLYEGEAENKLRQKKKKYKDSYRVDFYQMNLRQELFEELLQTAGQKEDEERWKEVCQSYGEANMTYENLQNYRQRIYEKYGQKITLSPALEEWVARVTKDCSTGYQRLRAIENALQGLHYTTTPGELPAEIDTPEEFLDYFLLEKGEGYCTYFATAFALLARTEGYPARYVQGFCVPIKDKKEMTVASWMSHAWCEVYFDGMGWIPFEPTSGYGSMRYTPWAPRVKQEVTYPDFSNWHEEERENEILAEEAETAEELSGRKNGKLFAVAALLSVAVAAVILAVDIGLGRRSYRRKDRREKYRFEAERNLAVLKKLGVRRQEYETLQELGYLVQAKYEEWEEKCPVFLEQYEEVLYGELPVNEEMLAVVRAERQTMLAHLGKWAGVRERYYLLKTGTSK